MKLGLYDRNLWCLGYSQCLNFYYFSDRHACNPEKENFSGQKVHRHLEFRNQMGSVTLEIEIGDRIDTIVCSPVQAAIINYCSEREISTVEEISKESMFHPVMTSL